eukprot:TRINITY_DN15698_c0_g1_i1.p1 TRINITY_DN15698_c0_g1~~TRINITY_DN15698_c0_g1_i1.p1  ORF type:complete len:243 (-),score=3.86 TRINITY_DN15698_c0_g1_i1:63-791(-)
MSISCNAQPRTASSHKLEADIEEQLSCPICFNLAAPPIFQCTNGHIICHGCYPSLQHCPVCRVEYRDPIRCRALEEISGRLLIECEYEGCGCRLPIILLAEHQRSCTRRPMNCYACGQKLINSEDYFLHLTLIHNVRHFTTSFGKRLKFREAKRQSFILTCDQRHVLISVETMNGSDVKMAVTFLEYCAPQRYTWTCRVESKNDFVTLGSSVDTLDNIGRYISASFSLPVHELAFYLKLKAK